MRVRNKGKLNEMKRSGVILLLENSTDYLFLLDQAFRREHIFNPLRVARYGSEAILYLKGVGIYGDRARYPLPDLVIIDLSIPDGSAVAVLGWIRRQPAFAGVPMVVLVDNDHEKLAHDTFDRGANAYSIERDDFAGMSRMIRSLEISPVAPGLSDEAKAAPWTFSN